MTPFYHNVKNYIKKDFDLPSSIFLQFYPLCIYFTLISILFTMANRTPQINSIPPRLGFLFLLVFFIARGCSVYNQFKIMKTSQSISQIFIADDLNKLLDEIENSLKNSIEFTKWSTGIIATILILITSQILNVSQKLSDYMYNTLSIEEKKLFLNTINNQIFYNLSEILTLTISTLILYYLIIQSTTFNRRIVRKIIKQSQYSITKEKLPTKKIEIAKFILKETFFLTK